MNWKEEIRKTIYRELPGNEKRVMEAAEPGKFNNALSDEPIWEKTVRAVMAEEETVLYSDGENDTAFDILHEKSEEPQKESTAKVHETVKTESVIRTQDALDKPEEPDTEQKADKNKSGEVSEQAREWLFKENMRLEGLRGELAKASRLMQEEADKLKAEQEKLELERKRFESEKEEFRKEMHELNSEIRRSKKLLNDEKGLFDKKYKILEMGYAKLNEDKKEFESQKRAFEYKKKFFYDSEEFSALGRNTAFTGDILFFKGANHPLAVKKRYKELIKIYHPDNTDGDKNILQRINMEYERLRKTML